jgi:hypothetical protein
VDKSLNFGAPENGIPVTVTVTAGDAWILGGERVGPPGRKTATVVTRGGKAAIWVVAGTTPNEEIQVTASSPGLSASTVSIGAIAPASFYGVPLDPPDSGGQNQDRSITWGRQATADSGAFGAPALYAIDEDPATAWRSAEGAAGAWWQVDLEDMYDISEIRISWDGEQAYKYWLQYSTDGKAWLPLADRTGNAQPQETTEFAFGGNSAKSAKFIRILFVEAATEPFAIREFWARGELSSASPNKDRADGKPSFALGLATDSSASYGNDGSPATFATMGDGEPGHMWWVDMEGFYDISAFGITWDNMAEHAYKIETSSDGVTWRAAVFKNRSGGVEEAQTDDVLPAAVPNVRFVRLVTAKSPQPLAFSKLAAFGGPSADWLLGREIATGEGTTVAATDGDDSTVWRPDAPGGELVADLGETSRVEGVSVRWEGDGPRHYALLGSPDGEIWYSYFSGASSGQTVAHSVSMPGTRYIKLLDEEGEGVATFSAYATVQRPVEVSGARNLLLNPGFGSPYDVVDPAGIPYWEKRPHTDYKTSAIVAVAGPKTGATHNSEDANYVVVSDTSAFSSSLCQTVEGIPDGLYEFRAWVKRGGPTPSEMLAYVEDYGGPTLFEDLKGAKYPVLANDPAGTAYTEMVIEGVHVTNGRATVGFYVNGAAGSFLMLDDVSFRLLTALPQRPPLGLDMSGYADISKIGGVVSARYVAYNGSEKSKTLAGVVACYTGNRLMAMETKEFTVGPGQFAIADASMADYDPEKRYAAFLWDATSYVPVCEGQTLSIKRIDPVNLSVTIRDDYMAMLPDKVTVRYNDSASGYETLPVVWKGEGPMTVFGAHVVEGDVEGTPMKAMAMLTVGLENLGLDDWPQGQTGPSGWVNIGFGRGTNPGDQYGGTVNVNYSAAVRDKSLYQLITLPAGVYRISCWSHGDISGASEGEIVFYYADASTPTEPAAKSPAIDGFYGWQNWRNPSYVFSIEKETSVAIGVKSTVNGGWFNMDAFNFEKIS